MTDHSAQRDLFGEDGEDDLFIPDEDLEDLQQFLQLDGNHSSASNNDDTEAATTAAAASSEV